MVIDFEAIVLKVGGPCEAAAENGTFKSCALILEVWIDLFAKDFLLLINPFVKLLRYLNR